MKLKIKDTEVEIKNRMRAYLIYEQITNKTFNPKTLTELTIYLYCLILANAKDISLTYGDFIDYIDEHMEIIDEFTNWIQEQNEIQGQFTDVKKKMEVKSTSQI